MRISDWSSDVCSSDLPQFGHQYSEVWIDFRGIQDDYMRARGIDYFENSRRATLAQRTYAIENPMGWKDYGKNVWGLTASDGPQRTEQVYKNGGASCRDSVCQYV